MRWLWILDSATSGASHPRIELTSVNSRPIRYGAPDRPAAEAQLSLGVRSKRAWLGTTDRQPAELGVVGLPVPTTLRIS